MLGYSEMSGKDVLYVPGNILFRTMESAANCIASSLVTIMSASDESISTIELAFGNTTPMLYTGFTGEVCASTLNTN
jgi:hypothetical protein